MDGWMKITDLEHNETYYEGIGKIDLEKSGICLTFATPTGQHRWRLAKQGAILENSSEVKTKAFLRPDKVSKMEVDTPYGSFTFPLDHVVYKRFDHYALMGWNCEGQTFSFKAQYDVNQSSIV